jgi:chromate reductase, NAD(P)H dehydrogenase (quinone)
MQILAISGSLRAASSNSSLIRALAALAPEGVQVRVYEGLAQLPHFNPDLDIDPAPAAVASFRDALRESDAVVISSPEYAHGVPGVLKNALDWLVGSGELIDKPIAVINASPRGTHAYASLVETLKTMSGRIVADASVTVAVTGRLRDEHEICEHAAISLELRRALEVLTFAVARV